MAEMSEEQVQEALRQAMQDAKKERQEYLRGLPKSVLLKIAIELDPEVVAEDYDEGWTKDDIINVIKRHVREAIGRQNVTGWQYIRDVDIVDVSEEY